MIEEELLGLTPEQAKEALGEENVRVHLYRTPRGETAGDVLRVVRARREGETWVLTVCGFPCSPHG